MYTSKARIKSCLIYVRFTPTEKKYIEIRAREAGLSASAFLREVGMKDSPKKIKTLPSEVLAFNGQLSGIVGAMEIIAQKRLDNEDLDGLQRAELNFRAKEIKIVIESIKSYLQ
jgi:hypothetical protein